MKTSVKSLQQHTKYTSEGIHCHTFFALSVSEIREKLKYEDKKKEGKRKKVSASLPKRALETLIISTL